MALVKSKKEIQNVVANGGECVDGTPYSVSADVLEMFPLLIIKTYDHGVEFS